MSQNILDLAIEDALKKMDDEQKLHFKILCGTLLACYVMPHMHGLLLVGRDDDALPGETELTEIISVNASDMHASQLVTAGQQQVSTMVMAEAPPREFFN